MRTQIGKTQGFMFMVKIINPILVGLVVVYCLALSGCSARAVKGDLDDKQVGGLRILLTHFETPDHKEMRLWFSAPNIIFEDMTGIYWAGNLIGIYKYDEKRDQWLRGAERHDEKSFEAVAAICQDKKGNVWVLSGLDPDAYYFDGRSWHKPLSIKPTTALRAMFQGRNGKVWFVLDEEMVAYDGDNWTSVVKPSEVIAQAYNKLKIGKIDYLLSERVKPSGRIPKNKRQNVDKGKTKSTVPFSDILSGLHDRKGNIWLGTEKAILRFMEDKQEWKVYGLPDRLREAFSIYEDRWGRVWFADAFGQVSVYDETQDNWATYRVVDYIKKNNPDRFNSTFYVKAIYQDKNGRMMFATKEGLIIFQENNNQWQIFDSQNSDLPRDNITSIFEDKAGRVWMGITGGIVILEVP
ncbi:MAG: two-component regulator propeller domain-containing protein [Acidobacteriota bacterium]